LNNSNFKIITEDLLETFLAAGKIAQDISNEGVKIEIKPDNTPVTNGDLAVDKIIREKIQKLTPNIQIISEETVDLAKENNDKTFWLVDPIDGTRDYIKKGDEYTLNASLITDLKPSLGVIYAPAKDRLFFSYGKDQCYEIHNGNKTKLNSNNNKVNKNKIIALSNSDNTPDEVLSIYKKYKVTETIRMSSSLKFCILAAGEADIYAAKARAYEWDIAAGHTILEHAGGSVTDHSEKEFLYGKKDYKNLPIIAKRSSKIEL
jgi:3'(2'), 5'-bisphosphate nucleotidase